MSIDTAENLSSGNLSDGANVEWQSEYMEKMHAGIEDSGVYREHTMQIAAQVEFVTPEDGTVINIGAGRGSLEKALLVKPSMKNVMFISVEPNETAAESLEGLRTQVLRTTFPNPDIGLPQASVDTAVYVNSLYVLSKSLDAESAKAARLESLKQTRELLREGGHLIISDPIAGASAKGAAIIDSLFQEATARMKLDGMGRGRAINAAFNMFYKLASSGFIKANQEIQDTHIFLTKEELIELVTEAGFTVEKQQSGYFGYKNLIITAVKQG